MKMYFAPHTASTTGDTIVFDHVNGIAYAGNLPLRGVPIPEPPGPLSRAQDWLWKRKRGGWLGNRIGDVRYALWWVSK